MKRWLKIVLIVLVSMIVLLFVTGLILHESRPAGTPGPQADALAQKMLRAVDATAWDSTAAVSWNFADRNQHLWDKKRHYARVRWGSYEVLVDLNEITGIARKNGEIVTGKASQKLVQKAWHRWANDSFWLNPAVKAFDPGTERSIVRLEDGREGLMITYTTGGATPGDSYLWLLNEKGRPYQWKMWVNIIPIGGVKVTWEDWITLPGGAQVATLHNWLIPLQLKEVQGGSLADIAPGGDPFAALEAR